MRRLNAMRRRLRRGVIPAAVVFLLLVLSVAGSYSIARLRGMTPATDLLHASESALLHESIALGFRLKVIAVEGRIWTKPSEIMTALAAKEGMPIFAVDLARAQKRLEALAWVRSAAIERRLPSTIFVALSERRPLALWQHDGKIVLIDERGTVIQVKNLRRFAKLPLVVGPGAPRHAAALIEMLAQEPALAARVTAAIWVGGRRWNLRLDNAITVLLPEKGAASAWSELARIERSGEVLKHDVTAVDLRLPGRLVLRVSTPPERSEPSGKEGGAAAKRT